MKLFTKAITAKLSANNAAQDGTKDFKPVVKLFVPWGAGTWLLSEMDENGIAFGLCDLGHGSPEMGYVDTNEIMSVRGPFGLKIERDMRWKADRTLTEYATKARAEGRIAA
jgi:hypothetical protein